MPDVIAQRGPDPLAVLAGFFHRFVVVHGDVFALLAIEEVIDVAGDRRDLEDDKDVGAEIEDLGRNVTVDAGYKRDDGNDRGNPDHDS